jgi:hypothetical protein
LFHIGFLPLLRLNLAGQYQTVEIEKPAKQASVAIQIRPMMATS